MHANQTTYIAHNPSPEMDQLILLATAAAIVLSTLAVMFFSRLFGRQQPAPAADASPPAAAPSSKFLTRERQRVPLDRIVELSHDTKLFRFKLPQSDASLGLPCGKHIKVFAPNPNAGGKSPEWNGKEDEETEDEIERKYTPTSSDLDLGVFDLVIKVYKPNERFAQGGKVSQYFDSLKVGDEVEISGPWGIIEYVGKGLFKKSSKEIKASDILMIAGGSGITPMLQIIEAVLRDKDDPSKISLIFGNQAEGDILLRSRLDELAAEHKDRFKVHYTLDRPPAEWAYSTGFITKEMIEDNAPPASDSTVVLLCGPPPMIKFCKGNLEALSYAKDRQLEF